MTAVELIDAQVRSYNKHDLEGFLSWYDDNTFFYNANDREPFMQGKNDMRERYGQRFSNTQLHVKILNRISIGNNVIDEEDVTISPTERSRVVVVYTVENEKITAVRFLR